jgi:chromosome segregation ATPase
MYINYHPPPPQTQSTTLSTKSSKAKNALNDEEDEDMDVSFIREEVSAQKEIIISRDQTIEKLQREIECLNGRIGQLKEESETTKECFEAEKTHWIDEKEKVIRYQKQLQLNYVQMYKRNKTLEAEIETLNKSYSECEKQLETTQIKLKEKEQEKQRPGSSSSNTSGGASSKGAAAAQRMIRKTGNSVRARLLKMSLHSESQC